jgi:hypothetical protein
MTHLTDDVAVLEAALARLRDDRRVALATVDQDGDVLDIPVQPREMRRRPSVSFANC